MPGWFRLALAGAGVALAITWVDYLVNWRWVLSWLTGAGR
jgi:hypothetical protein